ncbi:hypothetical protein BC332_11112 [Capsicum chinense]|nr:hypothetical protein BC332_11112 [Capsicum chinense]
MLSKLQFWERDFDGGLLQCISEVTYENDIKKVPSAPDVSNYLISEDEPSAVNRNGQDEPSAVNRNKDSLRFNGMADNEVETRLKCNRFVGIADNELERRLKEALLTSTSVPSQMKNFVLMIKLQHVTILQHYLGSSVHTAFVVLYVNYGRPFWQHIVSSSTGCSDSQYFQELYNYCTTEKAWHLSNPDAEKVFKALRVAGVKLAVVSNFDTQLKPVLRALNCDHWFDAVAVSAEVAWHLCDPDSEKVFKALRAAGVKLAVVSNFDTQLRPVLRALNCDHWFDAVAVSTEVEAEKPNPTIFLKACELLEVNPDDVHVVVCGFYIWFSSYGVLSLLTSMGVNGMSISQQCNYFVNSDTLMKVNLYPSIMVAAATASCGERSRFQRELLDKTCS